MHLTKDLAQTSLFDVASISLSTEERIIQSYNRARAIAEIYSLTPEDVKDMSSKFWLLHTDPIFTLDGAAGTLLAIQYNLFVGTVAMFSGQRQDLEAILKRSMSLECLGLFCLTELGHGLDAIHLETTATFLPDSGGFILNTPCDSAAKYMAPTAPFGVPCLAVVYARTLVNKEDHGIKPFLVPIHDGANLNEGVVCKVLPYRGGSSPVPHSLTYFHNVKLEPSALLGSIRKPVDPRATFFINISRVASGTIGMAAVAMPYLKVAAHISAKYSVRRMVMDGTGQNIPIISFRTQKIPVLTALAQSSVMDAMISQAIGIFTDSSRDPRVRHAIACIAKVVAIQHAQRAQLELGDRCGAQGLFEVNQLSLMHADTRGMAIAEGDLLGISIRLATELLLKRYSVPDPIVDDSILAKHEAGMFEELRSELAKMSTHRSKEFDRLILPQCFKLVEAIGHRFAFDAAISRGVDRSLIDLYVASCVKLDSAWYAETGLLSRAAQRDMEASAVDSVFPRLEQHLQVAQLDPYIRAPLVSDEKWGVFVDSLMTRGMAPAKLT